ncbi:pantoate--beta-alanine ligase, partial [Vibrio fluvialis]|uniref:pantoate--beta-alanine ligase n=1 Tax=Vibrio fluvialis TaxID=676 RepID=UPI001EEC116D
MLPVARLPISPTPLPKESYMQVFADIAVLREQIKQIKREGRRVAFVPNMGNLHEGH